MAKRKGISLNLPLDGELDAVAADREESDDPVDAGSHYIEQKVVKPSGKPAGNLRVDYTGDVHAVCDYHQERKDATADINFLV